MAFTQDWSPLEVPTTPDEKRRQLDEDYRNDDELDRERLSRAESPDPDDDDEFDDEDLDADDDDLDFDDDDMDDDDDLDLDYDESQDEDDEEDDYRVEGIATAQVTNETDPDPNEIPEQEESDNESLGYPDETEYEKPEGDDASYEEQTGVVPPRETEIPSLGSSTSEISFEKRDQGRTTGRMLGHEPGTEGI